MRRIEKKRHSSVPPSSAQPVPFLLPYRRKPSRLFFLLGKRSSLVSVTSHTTHTHLYYTPNVTYITVHLCSFHPPPPHNIYMKSKLPSFMIRKHVSMDEYSHRCSCILHETRQDQSSCLTCNAPQKKVVLTPIPAAEIRFRFPPVEKKSSQCFCFRRIHAKTLTRSTMDWGYPQKPCHSVAEIPVASET